MSSKPIIQIASELLGNLSRYPVYLSSSKSAVERKRRQNLQRLMKNRIKLLSEDLSQSINLLIKN